MNIFFVTSTIKNWISLFDDKAFRDIVIGSIQFMIHDTRILLHGYVIMPNHIHKILTVRKSYILSQIFRDFHKYTSQQIIKIMRNNKDSRLSQFRSDRNDRLYQIWQTTHSPKEIETFLFFRQKLEYIHNNPCTEHWRLSKNPEDYPFSSARDYLLDIPGILQVDKILQ